jgi:hypothetical protein
VPRPPIADPGERQRRFEVVYAAHRGPMLRERHVTVPVFNYSQSGFALNVRHVPGTWYVYDATPWAPGQVLLFVGPTRTQRGNQAPQPGTPSPVPDQQGAAARDTQPS